MSSPSHYDDLRTVLGASEFAKLEFGRRSAERAAEIASTRQLRTMLIEKLAIGLLLVGAGFYANHEIEAFKSTRATAADYRRHQTETIEALQRAASNLQAEGLRVCGLPGSSSATAVADELERIRGRLGDVNASIQIATPYLSSELRRDFLALTAAFDQHIAHCSERSQTPCRWAAVSADIAVLESATPERIEELRREARECLADLGRTSSP